MRDEPTEPVAMQERRRGGYAGGILLVTLVSTLGGYAMGRLAADDGGAPQSVVPVPLPALDVPESEALRDFDDAWVVVGARPRFELVAQKLAAFSAALPPELAASPRLAPAWDEWAALERRRGDIAAANVVQARASAVDPDPTRTQIRAAIAAEDAAALRAHAAESAQDRGERWPAATLVLLGRALGDRGLDDAMWPLFERAVAASPADYDLRIAWAEQLCRRGFPAAERAHAMLTAAMALRPDSRRAALRRLFLLAETLGHGADAVALAQAALRRFPNDPWVAWAGGLALASARHFDEARVLFARAARVDPRHPLALAAIGATWLEEEELTRALDAAKRSLECARTADAIEVMATALERVGDRAAEAALLDEAATDGPVDARLLDLRAWSLVRRGLHGQAIEALRDAVRLDPWEAQCQNDLAWLLATGADLARRDAGRALAHAERACELAPESAWYRNTLGVTCYRVGDFERASELLGENVERGDGGSPFDLCFLAMAKQQLGASDEARALFGRAVERTADERSEELERILREARELLGIVAGDGGAGLPERRDG